MKTDLELIAMINDYWRECGYRSNAHLVTCTDPAHMHWFPAVKARPERVVAKTKKTPEKIIPAVEARDAYFGPVSAITYQAIRSNMTNGWPTEKL